MTDRFLKIAAQNTGSCKFMRYELFTVVSVGERNTSNSQDNLRSNIKDKAVMLKAKLHWHSKTPLNFNV